MAVAATYLAVPSFCFCNGVSSDKGNIFQSQACLFQVCAFNRTVQKVDEFLANEAKGTRVIGARSLEEMAAKLKKPRRVMLLVKAGSAVDDFIHKLASAVIFV